MKVKVGLFLVLVLVTAGMAIATNATALVMDETTEKYFRLEPNGYSITFPEPNDEQLKIIEKLVGKNITMGEYIEKVCPELLKDVPENIIEQLYSTKIVWPSEKAVSFATEKAVNISIKEYILRLDKSELWLAPEWPHLKHTSWSEIIYPWHRTIPFMAVESYLWYRPILDWPPELKSFTAKACSNCYEVRAEKVYTATYGGYWRVTGHHWGDYPSGYNPPDYDSVTDTGWVHVGP